MHRCRCRGAEMQNCRDADEVPKCSVAVLQWCSGAQIKRRFRGAGAEVQRCRGAEV